MNNETPEEYWKNYELETQRLDKLRKKQKLEIICLIIIVMILTSSLLFYIFYNPYPYSNRPDQIPAGVITLSNQIDSQTQEFILSQFNPDVKWSEIVITLKNNQESIVGEWSSYGIINGTVLTKGDSAHFICCGFDKDTNNLISSLDAIMIKKDTDFTKGEKYTLYIGYLSSKWVVCSRSFIR